MGDVYAGYDEKLERKVALKVLNSDQRLDDEARERLLREARALSKLEHPNICRIHDYIETGDVDLLVLEYIDGRTLHDALSPKMPRSEKLRIAAAIAEVLVKAHRAGIVHRDLKPENVMLTRGGEVKVLDFGLARWLTRAKKQSSERLSAVRVPVRATPEAATRAETMVMPPAASDRFQSDGGRREFLATAVGITLGTPIFMSPEQARGESLTPASDMFSFGLLLQTLFTGEDPHPMGLTAREVILRVARGETLPVSKQPGDVTALINRLKQFAPADRPTAIEALERLRTMEEKPQRIARRAIVGTLALIALLGAWRYTVDLKRERAIAVEARAEADHRRAQAEDLIEFMIGDLRRKLEPVGRLDVLDAVGERALAYSASLNPSLLTADELVRNAKALHQLVQVRIAQGKLNEAVANAQRALALTEAAAKRDSTSAQVQLAHATSYFWTGNVRRLRGEYPDALRDLQRYRDIAVGLSTREPANDEYRLERAYGHSAVATILEAQGKLPAALEQYATTIAVKRERLRADPSNVDKQADLAMTLNKVGFVLQRSGRLLEAREHFDAEHAIYDRLVRTDPQQRKWRDRLAVSHSYLAALLELTGDYEGALRHRQSENAMFRELHEHDAANIDWKRDYAVSTMRIADLMRRRGDAAGALPLFARTESLVRQVIAADASRPTWRRDLGIVQAAHSRALAASGATGEAIRLARHAEVSLLALPLTDPTTRRCLADAQLALGDAYRAAGRQEDAREAWRRALDTIHEVGRASNDPVVVEVWASALIRAGRADEASPALARLRQAGYGRPDVATVVARANDGAVR
jgi:serine/threonine-protein kinase